MRFLFFFQFFYFSLLNCHAQSSGSIQGLVYDALTNEALPGANVYFAKTAIGMPTNKDGSFTLSNISRGKYDLTVSMVGYKTFSKSFVFDENAISGLKIYLERELKVLNEVVVTSKRSLENEYFKFEKIFLGQTQNAAKCKVLNPQVVDAHQTNGTLFAEAYKPIEIVNNALGYRIFYQLKQFVYNSNAGYAFVSGTPRFENLVPKNKKQELKWNNERKRAYRGSIEHFIRALKNRQLKKNNFKLFDSSRNEIPQEKLFANDAASVIRYKGKLIIVYGGELAERIYDPQQREQESVLNFNGNNVVIYDNGIYDRFQDILLEGYLGWASRIAELIPLDYQPDSK